MLRLLTSFKFRTGLAVATSGIVLATALLTRNGAEVAVEAIVYLVVAVPLTVLFLHSRRP